MKWARSWRQGGGVPATPADGRQQASCRTWEGPGGAKGGGEASEERARAAASCWEKSLVSLTVRQEASTRRASCRAIT